MFTLYYGLNLAEILRALALDRVEIENDLSFVLDLEAADETHVRHITARINYILP